MSCSQTMPCKNKACRYPRVVLRPSTLANEFEQPASRHADSSPSRCEQRSPTQLFSTGAAQQSPAPKSFSSQPQQAAPHPPSTPTIKKYEPPRALNEHFYTQLKLGEDELRRLGREHSAGGAYNLNITGRALASWGVTQAVDEFIQNLHDQAILMVPDGHRKYVKIEYEKGNLDHGAASSSTPFENVKINLVLRIGDAAPSYLGSLSFRNKVLRLTNYKTLLAPVCFIGGYSGEEKTADEQNRKLAKGKFGDGLKSGCAVLVAKGVGLKINTRGYEYRFSFRKQDCFRGRSGAAETLHYQVLATAPGGFGRNYDDDFSPETDTQVVLDLSGMSGANARLDITRYLFLDTRHRGHLLKTPPATDYEIIVPAGGLYGGRIYVKEMLAVGGSASSTSGWAPSARTAGQSGPVFGYNLKAYEAQARDRLETMSDRDKKREICAAWAV